MTSRARSPGLLALTAWLATFAATPAVARAGGAEDAVAQVLTRNWRDQEHKTWEKTTGNTVRAIYYTPMDVWSGSTPIEPYQVAVQVFDHSLINGNGADLRFTTKLVDGKPVTVEDGRDQRVCGEDQPPPPLPARVPDAAARVARGTRFDGEPIAQCRPYNLWRRADTDPVVHRCGAQSDKLIDDVWHLAASARQQLDIATLFEPDGRFLEALRNGIAVAATRAAASGRTLLVRVVLYESHVPPKMLARLDRLHRLVTGRPLDLARIETAAGANPIEQATYPDRIAAELARGLSPDQAAHVRIFVGIHHPSATVWNHSKILAVDGERALVGGHNLADGGTPGFPYNDRSAVHDLSILVEGPAALSAHRFAGQLWDVICAKPEAANRAGTQMVWTTNPRNNSAVLAATTRRGRATCPAAVVGALPAPRSQPEAVVALEQGTEPVAGVTIYGVGRLGDWKYGRTKVGRGQNPADDALVALIAGSTGDILISQQNLSGSQHYGRALEGALARHRLPAALKQAIVHLADWATATGLWMDPVLDAIAGAAAAGRKVRIIVADPHAAHRFASAGAPKIIRQIMSHWPSMSAADVARLACNLEVVHLRQSFLDPQYPDGWLSGGSGPAPAAPGNHSKLVIVDPGRPTAGMYVGSQNLYAHDLAEYGYIVFGQPAVQQMMSQVWSHAWTYSAGVGGADIVRPDECVSSGPAPATPATAPARVDDGPSVKVTNGAPAVTLIGQDTYDASALRRATDFDDTQPAFDRPSGVVDVGVPDDEALYVVDGGNGQLVEVVRDTTGAGWTAHGIFPADYRTPGIDFSRRGEGGVSAANIDEDTTVVALTDSVAHRVVLLRGDDAITLGFATSDGTINAATLDHPTGVWTDGRRLVVADTGNHRVLIWDRLPTGYGVSADRVLGQPDTRSKTPGAALDRMNGPRGVYADGERLFVADSGNNRVLIFDDIWTTRPTTASVVLGQPSATSSAAGAGRSGMRSPRGLAVAGNTLFVADSGNHRILVYLRVPTSSGVEADRVLGQADFDGKDAASGQTRLDDPQDLSATVLDQVILSVADRGNHRVLQYRFDLDE